ncbi:DUF1043 domain-containing protein [Aliidiomarina iranensis]|uniref:Z-ring associated protein G n=1 Tax=Aliidiomarina iranensis TaxID=1434071 RepID=A0A432W2P1_9GAMM|nr:DUF1043 family protein [Aliidiomarina iranensis]RUO23502.1 DUF1043 domain-containing protein [Aliidiomarina iranensis]
MDWLIGILLLIAGAIIGFFLARLYLAKTGDAAELKMQIENSQQQFEAYRKDVVEQLASARQLASEVTDIQHRLNLFLQDSQHLLEQDKDWQQPLLFSEETIRSIRKANTLNRDRRDDSELADETPPRDYSEPGSGLFTPVPKAMKED